MGCPTLAELPAPPPGKSGWPWTEAAPALPAMPPDGGAWPRLSIVTPSFNDEAFVEEALRSVLLQGYPALEYVVVDGASRDGSVDIIRRYAPWLAGWTSGPDRGQAHALNKGFARTSGELMAWMNSSDKYLPGAFQAVAEVMTCFPDVQWLTSTLPTVCEVDGQARSFRVAGYSRRFFAVGGYAGLSYGTAMIQQESTFWRRTLWERAGGRVAETYGLAVDFELWSRFFRYASLASVEAMLGSFRVHPGQRSRTQAALYRQECLRALKRKEPGWLERAVRLFRRLRLRRFIGWRNIMRLLYGEEITAIVPHGERGWRRERRRVA